VCEHLYATKPKEGSKKKSKVKIQEEERTIFNEDIYEE
jgi:hypothetical protein